MRYEASAPAHGSARSGAARHRSVPALVGLLLLAVLLGLTGARDLRSPAVELRAGDASVTTVADELADPIRAVLPAGHTALVRTPPATAPSSFAGLLLLLALLGGFAAISRASWAGGRPGRLGRADASIAHAVPAAWRGPPAAR